MRASQKAPTWVRGRLARRVKSEPVGFGLWATKPPSAAELGRGGAPSCTRQEASLLASQKAPTWVRGRLARRVKSAEGHPLGKLAHLSTEAQQTYILSRAHNPAKHHSSHQPIRSTAAASYIE